MKISEQRHPTQSAARMLLKVVLGRRAFLSKILTI